MGKLFLTARRVGTALEHVVGSEGAFIALNDRVSQSVEHVHVHVIPRRKGDGLRGFFWPRQRYGSDEETARLATLIREALEV
jgi:histidine triad (HIT) family protein